MSDFEKARKRTDFNEGGYADVAGDRGGETYRGIARNFWGSWAGWPIIDSVKEANGITPALDEHLAAAPGLADLVVEFYKENFWENCGLGRIEDDYVAFTVYDAHVNLGDVVRWWIQKILNVLNQAGALWPDLECDGQIGPGTIAAWNECLAKPGYREHFLKCFEAMRISNYVDIAAKNPVDEQFMAGWLTRCELNERAEQGF